MSSTVIPTLHYRDARRMIGWLCDVLGFARHAIYEDGQGGIAHAQLTLGSGMVMLGSARDDEIGRLQSTPTDLGGTTQGPYLVVPDADEVYSRATAAGAEIVMQSGTKTTVAAGFRAVIRKATRGASAATIRGRRPPDAHDSRLQRRTGSFLQLSAAS
jgi:uncharacterized glyoxalase superfamily protein PhnB